MSQHHYKAAYRGKRVDVQFGWDRPCRGFYLVIQNEGARDDNFVYSNLNDESLLPYMGMPPTIDPLLAVLKRLGITIPQTMIEAVRQDGIDNVGNKSVIYDAAGNAKSPGRGGPAG